MLVRLCRDFLASWPERGYGFSSCFFRLALAQSLENLSLCSACQCVRFCSKEHQRAFWPRRGSDASMSREREGGVEVLAPLELGRAPGKRPGHRMLRVAGSRADEPTSRRRDARHQSVCKFLASIKGGLLQQAGPKMCRAEREVGMGLIFPTFFLMCFRLKEVSWLSAFGSRLSHDFASGKAAGRRWMQDFLPELMGVWTRTRRPRDRLRAATNGRSRRQGQHV